MNIKKSLAYIAIAGTLALGGCGEKADYSKYKFNGMIDEERVNFVVQRNFPFQNYNYLNVKNKEGKEVEYSDSIGNDLKIDSIWANGKSYSKDELGKEVLEIAQKQFDSYLVKILEHKRKEATRAITGKEYNSRVE